MHCRADRWYAGVTTERALAAAERRHAADLRERYADSVEWQDYSVRDLRLPWTSRQRLAVAVIMLLVLVGTLAGFVAGSVIVLIGACLVTAGWLPWIVRDCWRELSLWLLER